MGGGTRRIYSDASGLVPEPVVPTVTAPKRRNAQALTCSVAFERGAGLGNRLFPWARCEVYSHLHDVPMMAPRWVQLRVGPLIRGGIDLRAYHRQILLGGVFGNQGYVRGAPREPVIAEPADLGTVPTQTSGTIVFRGSNDLITPVARYRSHLLGRLTEITRPRWRRLAESVGPATIGVNVRLARDFRPAESPEDYYLRVARTPLEWYVGALIFVRKILGEDLPAVVVSDGRVGELRPLLELPRVTFLRPGCAISDLLGLARTQILIGTGKSSFSAWASFLGGMPTVVHPGQSLEWFGYKSERYVGELDLVDPPAAFVRDVQGS